MSPGDQAELRVMISQAFDQRGTPYLFDASEAIVEWNQRRYERAWARRQYRIQALAQLIRETSDPSF